jgi:phospholipase C
VEKLAIDHLFVLMLENRSFDQLFGARSDVDGVSSGRANADLAGRRYAPHQLSFEQLGRYRHDPPHDAAAIAEQLACDMSGFVTAFERERPGLPAERYGEVMGYLAPDALPMMNFLADHFAISDGWFSAIPTGTIPNRMYAMCGHSVGERDNPKPLRFVAGYDVEDSIFHKLDEHFARTQRAGEAWRVYSGTRPPWVAMIAGLRDDLFFRGRMKPMLELAHDLEALDEESARAFPALTWLEPSYHWTEHVLTDVYYAEPNCDHPPSDMMRGQALVQYVYDALRKSALWPNSALVITYDEHGGFYDHVLPPACRPGRDGFTTRGPRVPTLVVSPKVAPGSVVRAEPGRAFDHTSIAKFLCEQFDIAPWTPRLCDDSTLSLRAFFDANLNSAAPDSGLDLPLRDALRLDLKLDGDEPPASLEGIGMRALRAALQLIGALRD